MERQFAGEPAMPKVERFCGSPVVMAVMADGVGGLRPRGLPRSRSTPPFLLFLSRERRRELQQLPLGRKQAMVQVLTYGRLPRAHLPAFSIPYMAKRALP
jgi:hypothetical protein